MSYRTPKVHLLRPHEKVPLCGLLVRKTTRDPDAVTCKHCMAMFDLNQEWFDFTSSIAPPEPKAFPYIELAHNITDINFVVVTASQRYVFETRGEAERFIERLESPLDGDT